MSDGYEMPCYLTDYERRAIEFLDASFPDFIIDLKMRTKTEAHSFSWKITCVRDFVGNEIFSFTHSNFIEVFMLALKGLCENRSNEK